MKGRILLSLLIIFTSFSRQAQDVWDYMDQAAVAEADKEYEQAIEAYQKALALEPENPLVLFGLANASYEAWRYGQAISHAEQVIALADMMVTEAYQVQGMALEGLGSTEEAIQTLEAARALHDGYFLLHFVLARSYAKVEKYAEGEACLMEGLRLNPGHTESSFLLSQMSSEMLHPARAIIPLYSIIYIDRYSEQSNQAYESILTAFAHEQEAATNMEAPFAQASTFLAKVAREHTEDDYQDSPDRYIMGSLRFLRKLILLSEGQSGSIWWEFYGPFFKTIMDAGHLETFLYYTARAHDPEAKAWLDSHHEEFEAFANWIQE